MGAEFAWRKFFFQSGLAFFLATLIPGHLLAETRYWTFDNNRQFEGDYQYQTATHAVFEVKRNSNMLEVDKRFLSKHDQEYLRLIAVAEAKKGPQPPPEKKPDQKRLIPIPRKADAEKRDAQAAKSSSPFGSEPPAPNPKKLESPAIRYPLENDYNALKPLTDHPATDYAQLVRELLAPVEPPRFVAGLKFKLPLASPETAVLAPMGRFLLDHQADQEQLAVWYLETGKLFASIKVGPLINSRCFAISPSGRYVAAGQSNNMAVVYDVETRKELMRLDMNKLADRKLVRVALNWDDDECALLTDHAEIHRQSLQGDVYRRHSFVKNLPAAAENWANNSDEARLMISGYGRFGARLTDRYTYTCYIEALNTGFKADAYRPYLAIPVRNGLIYWSRDELVRYGVSYPYAVNPAKPEPGTTIGHRAVDCLDFAQVSLDRQERYMWVTNAKGSQTVDIYDLDTFHIPLRVPTPLSKQGEAWHWHSAEARRLYSWNPSTQELSTYEIPVLEPPPVWKLEREFHTALLEKRYDRLEGLANELAKDMRPVRGGSQLPVLTAVIRSFHRTQFYVPQSQWEDRITTWIRERPNSKFAKLVFANGLVESALIFQKNEPLRKGEGPQNRDSQANTLMADHYMKQLFKENPQPSGDMMFIQLRLAPMLGWQNDKLLELAAQMAKVAPEHTEFHYEMCRQMLPERFGEVNDTETYAKTIADHFPGEKGDILYGKMVYRCKEHYKQEDFFQFLEFDWQRATRGLLADAQKNPDDAAAICRAYDWHQFYHQANRQQQFQSFAKDYAPILAAYKKLQETYAWNVYTMPQEERGKVE